MAYVRSTPFETEFQGRKVTATIKPLNIPHAFELQAHAVKKEDDAKTRRDKTFAAMGILQRVLPEYVTDLKGVQDADGAEVGISELCNAAYFITLVNRLGQKLIATGTPQDPQEPSELSADESEGDGLSSAIRTNSVA